MNSNALDVSVMAWINESTAKLNAAMDGCAPGLEMQEATLPVLKEDQRTALVMRGELRRAGYGEGRAMLSLAKVLTEYSILIADIEHGGDRLKEWFTRAFADSGVNFHE